MLLLHGFPELAYSWRKVMPMLAEAGYSLSRVRPFDLFPHTPHVECVARFDRS